MWPEHQKARAPVHDFPPRWASAWGDDPYGLWADCSVAAPGQAHSVTQRMRWIEPGTFWMGSALAERRRIQNKDARNWANKVEPLPHPVTLTEGFWLADTPCTQALWRAVMGNNPSHFSRSPDSSRRPVENVAYDDPKNPEASVLVFLQRLQILLPVEVQAALPNEAEWEYSCRAGDTRAYWWGDEWDHRRGNAVQKNQGTTTLDMYAPNPWGLHDVHGNVWEWTQSPWRERLDDSAQKDNHGLRVVRGGSWSGHPALARAAYRDGWPPAWRAHFASFRLLLRLSSTKSSQ